MSRESDQLPFGRCRLLASPKRIALNPYFATISEGMEKRGWQVESFSYLRGFAGRFDILHVHFPTFPFNNRRLWITAARLLLFGAVLILLRARGKKIVWTVHNLAHHERHHPTLEKAFMRWFTGMLDLTIHLSESGRAAALERFPRLRGRPSLVIPHAHYREPPPDGPTAAEAAGMLGLDRGGPILLFFGQIRPYKNIPELIRVFSELQRRDTRLLIVGGVADDRLAREVKGAASDDRVLLRLAPVPDDQLHRYLAAATLIVLPYREILNSGSALLGLTHARPLLIPDRGAMAELQSKVGADWARLFTPPLSSEQLDEAISWAEEPRTGRPDLRAFDPAAVVQAHMAAFAGLLSPEVATGHPRKSPHRS